MNKLTSIFLLLLIAACSTVTPNYDKKFGAAVSDALKRQTIDPDAGKIPDQVLGIDGKAARDTMQLYHGTFKEPPPVVNVINIGGMGSNSSDSGGGGQR